MVWWFGRCAIGSNVVKYDGRIAQRIECGQYFWIWYIVWDGGADSLDGIRLARAGASRGATKAEESPQPTAAGDGWCAIDHVAVEEVGACATPTIACQFNCCKDYAEVGGRIIQALHDAEEDSDQA